MEICGCKSKCECFVFSLIASAVAGIITAFLNFSGTIAVSQIILWVFFGVALGFLAVALVAGALANRKEFGSCICSSLTTLFVGVLGTVLFSLVLILVDIATGGLLGSVLTGLLFAFFALTVTSVACVIREFFGCR